MKLGFLLFCLFAISAPHMSGQEVIELKNPSFETDPPAAGFTPTGWINLGAADQTPPDIQPGFFQMTMPAQDGENYLGLSVRESNTWEGVGQRLTDFLKKGSEYTFSVWMTRSNDFVSAVVPSGDRGYEVKRFNAPTILKIWGYNTQTNQEELLAESQPVGHSKWVRFEFTLKPSLGDYDEIDLMAYYAHGFELHNGNLFLDNCSAIVKVH
jgi:hypothetical protein